VPAVMLLFRRAAWYLPRWLDRLLPTVDIEGESLVRHAEDLEWAEGERRWALSSEGVVPPEPFRTEALDVHVEPGATASLAVPPLVRRGVVATLTGHLEPVAGRVQAAGAVAPSGARELRQVAAPVIDDGSAADGTAAALVAERLRFAPRRMRSGSTRQWLDLLPEALPRDRPIGLLAPEERLAVLALAAAAGGARVLVVDAGDLGGEAQGRLAALLDRVTDRTRAALVVTSPSPSASTRIGAVPARREV
jgi:putative drug exporter of the RND superfamily